MKKMHLIYIVIFSFVTTYKSYYSYDTFDKNNVPVYDGVMNENRQIRSYIRYKNNFSLIERFNQVIYEFEGNNLSAGFSCFIAFVCPSWFINDGDLLVRSFVAVLLFSLVLFNFLKNRTNSFNTLLIITLLFQLPLFYHFRYGLTTYVPEIPAALFLLSGYLQILNFFKSEKTIHFMLGCLFMVLAIMFRFNFFVYAAFFILPLLYRCFRIFLQKKRSEIIVLLGFIVLTLSFLAFYIFSHLDFFLGYYIKDIPYALISLRSSFSGMMADFKMEISVIGVLALFVVLILVNENKLEKRKVEILYLLYPFAFFFSFIILYLNATNVPHIMAAFVVFLLASFLVPSALFTKIYSTLKQRYVRLFAFLLIIVLNVNYVFSCISFSKTLPEQLGHRKVIDYMANEKNLSPTYKYICFYDESVEVQIDVALFKKTGVWLNSLNHFDVHDLYMAAISPELNSSVCTKHYMNMIDSVKFDLVIINKEPNTPLSGFKTAKETNIKVERFMETNQDYEIEKIIRTSYHGKLLLFKRRVKNENVSK